jgi:hypothetical protein
MPASLRNRLLSETRVAVCPNFGSVFVLWQEGVPEGSDQSTNMFWMAQWVISALFFILVFRRILAR